MTDWFGLLTFVGNAVGLGLSLVNAKYLRGE